MKFSNILNWFVVNKKKPSHKVYVDEKLVKDLETIRDTLTAVPLTNKQKVILQFRGSSNKDLERKISNITKTIEEAHKEGDLGTVSANETLRGELVVELARRMGI